MVRNSGILKMVLPFPTLSDQYYAGPREVSFTSRAIISMRMLDIMKQEQRQDKIE